MFSPNQLEGHLHSRNCFLFGSRRKYSDGDGRVAIYASDRQRGDLLLLRDRLLHLQMGTRRLLHPLLLLDIQNTDCEVGDNIIMDHFLFQDTADPWQDPGLPRLLCLSLRRVPPYWPTISHASLLLYFLYSCQ